jgi:glycosyltransferase involved in cell wall biosynthesis
VAIVTNILSPYRIRLFNALGRRKGIRLTVVLLAENEADRQWRVERSSFDFECHVLPGCHWFLARRELHVHLNWGLGRQIRRCSPDVLIVSGYDSLAFWSAMLRARTLHTPLVLWFESSLLSAVHSSGPIAAAKRFFVQRADAYVPFGTKARECLVALGADPRSIFTGLNTVDMDWYRRASAAIRQQSSFAVERSQYPPVMLLYVGRLVECKNARRLLEALTRLHDPDIGLFVVGSGPEGEDLKAFCRLHDVRSVYFEGFKQQAELPKYYALADALVLPSTREVWGLVVNEALATGLYVLCSDRAGATYDLIREGWNGRAFDPYDVDQLTEMIRKTNESIEDIRARREAISDHACSEYSIERSAQAFIEAIRKASGGPPRES